jgi:hypothetical protein
MRLASRVLAPLLGCVLLTAGCAAPSSGATPVADRAASSSPKVTKLLVVVVENHSLSQMKAGMPKTFTLAKSYAYATGYHAIRHPSLPNYLAIAGGSTFGVADDRPPSAHKVAGRSVFGQALRHGRTAATYADGMTSACSTTSYGGYAVKHNPWAYFVDERRACRAHDRGMKAFASAVANGRLPRVGMLVPNLCHDAHDCSLAAADDWFARQWQRIAAGPDWRSGHLAVVLTADEDDHQDGNAVLTVVLHPSLHDSGKVVDSPLTHYSLTRLYDEVAGLPYLRRAATAPSMAQAFGLPIG